MTQKSQAELDALATMDSLLDKNLEDVADLPEYLDRVPNGFYKLHIIECERKAIEIVKEEGSSEKIWAPITQLVFEVEECLELEDSKKNPAEDGAPVGSRFNMSFFWHKDVEKSASAMKTAFKDISIELGIANLGVLEKTLKGLHIGAKVKTTVSKKKEDTYYIRVTNAQLSKA